ncbi:MAG: Grx4 family monothiol glutaredoxin [Gammaproteobacteria bacterium]
MSISPELRARIEATIAEHPVVLFMKGTRAQPQCGFSATVVSILDGILEDYHTIDVLSDPDIREGIKHFSEWPTIPQLYIEREFVGGCDLVQQLYAAGDLHRTLGREPVRVEPPAISVSDAAAAALRDAAAQRPDLAVHLKIDQAWNHQFNLAPARGHELRVAANGVEVLFDVDSARRADGLRLDLVETDDGPGFVIDNPNSPAPVAQMTVSELKAHRDAGDTLHLFDVREQAERDIAVIEGAQLLDEAAVAFIDTLPRDAMLVFHCHSGVRSQAAAEYFRGQGYTNVYNLAGGIDAWSREIDPGVPRY